MWENSGKAIMAKKTAKKSGSKTVIIVKKDKPKKDYEVGKGKPPKHTQFKKGKSGNPGGVPADPAKRALRELTARSVKEAIEKTLTCTEAQVKALIDDPETTVGHKVILRAALNAAENGEYSRFNEILERAIGKVASKVDMNIGGASLNEKLENKEKVKAVLKEVENEF